MNLTRKPEENVWLWLAKLTTGALVLLLIFVHLVANHLIVEGGLQTYADVLHYVSIPGIALLEMAFLVFVVAHALLGTRSVILDLHPSPALLRILDVGFVLLGVGASVYGIWLMQLLVQQGL